MTASGQHESGRPGNGAPYADVPDQEPDVAARPEQTVLHEVRPVLAASAFGDWLGLLAITALAATLASGSYAETCLTIALVLVLRLAPAVFLGPVAGALTARLGPKSALLAGDLLRALLFLSIPLIGSLTWLYVATVLIAVSALLWSTAKSAALGAPAPGSQPGPALLAGLAFSVLSLLNGVLASFVDRFGSNPLDLVLYLTALTFAVSVVRTARLALPSRPGNAGEPHSTIRSIGNGRQLIGSTPVLRGLVTGLVGAVTAAGLVLGLAQIYVRDLGAGRPGYGVLFASVFLGLVLGRWAGPRLLAGFSRFRLFGLGLISAGAFLGAIALIPNMVMAALLTVGLGASAGVVWSIGLDLLERSTGGTVRGRALSFLFSATHVALLLVLAVGPGLAAVIGRHVVNFTDTHSLSYNGAAFVFLIAAVLTSALGVAVYRQLDDRPGIGLRQDLRASWSSRRTRTASPAQAAHSGVFVALEGGDGSGKSTQARLLADWLRSDQGHDVVLTREPGATPLGVRLREVLLGNTAQLGSRVEALLFAADRAHHVEAVVRPALARGAIVVTDRYIDSSVAYQGAGRELDGDEVQEISQWATDGLEPALTVLLDVDPVISKARRAHDLTRGGEDRLESESDHFHDRVRAEFLALAERAPHRYLVIDAGLSPDEVQQLIREGVRQVLPVSARRRAELEERLTEEDQTRERRARAEAEVLRMDADLRRRRVSEAREREEARRRARDEAERQLQQEAERELRAQESQRNREEVDRRASAAAAAAALGPVTEPVQMPSRTPPARRATEPPPTAPGQTVGQPEQPEQPDIWAAPSQTTQPNPLPQQDLWTAPARPAQQFADPSPAVQPQFADPAPVVQPQEFEAGTNPVPQRPQRPQRADRPEQPRPAPPRTVQLPEVDVTALEQEDRTINLADGENPDTGEIDNRPDAPLRRRGRRQA